MIFIITVIFFALGTIIGSFLNVVIYRLNTGKSLGGRSACMTCMNRIPWYDLLPIISFLALKGRCRSCEAKISHQYPWVEFLTGLIFSLIFLKFQYIFFVSTFLFTVNYAYYVAMFCILLVIAVYDIKHKIIPDHLVLVFGVLSFIGIFFFDTYGFNIHMPGVFEFLSGILIALPFALFWLLSRGAWMGLGDAKLAIGFGFLLGLSRALSGVVLAFWSGAIIGLFLIFLSKSHKMKSEIPFAPFLVLGAFLAFLFEIHLFPIGF